MTQLEYQRRYYELRKASGCFDCGKPPQKLVAVGEVIEDEEEGEE